MVASQDGYGNTPWGGIPVLGITIPQDGYGAMGWGNLGDVSQATKYEGHESVGGLVRGHDEHLTRSRDR